VKSAFLSGILVAASATGMCDTNRTERLNSPAILSAWEHKGGSIDTLSVTYLLYYSSSAVAQRADQEPKEDAPPIDPYFNKEPFLLYIFHKAGVKEAMHTWTFKGSSIEREVRMRYDGKRGFRLSHQLDSAGMNSAQILSERPGALDTEAPRIPFVLWDSPSKDLFEMLKAGKMTITPTAIPNDRKSKLTLNFRPIDAHPEIKVSVLIDPSLNYEPLEYKETVGETVRAVHRWSKHIEVLENTWVPQEYSGFLAARNGKIAVRNKMIILDVMANAKVPSSLFEPSPPAGALVQDLISGRQYIQKGPDNLKPPEAK
jgi:hypothetical protein